MKKLLGGLALAGILSVGIANAGTITTANADIEMEGALTAGYVATDNDSTGYQDGFHVTSADIRLINKTNSQIGFLLDMGSTYQASLLTSNLQSAGGLDFSIEIAYVSVKPVDKITIDAGLLATNVGYELYHPYENGNIIFGMVWNAQPVTYTGVRATFEAMENLSIYAEYFQDTNYATPKDGFAVGVIGSFKNIDYALSYFDWAADRNIVDFVVSTKLGALDVGLNFDYHYLDDSSKDAIKAAGATSVEDTAYGIAFYITPHPTNTISVPIRFEYVNDKDSTDAKGKVVSSGIYGVGGDSAYSLSITPTWKPNKNSFVRAELDYVKSDNNTSSFGNNEDTRMIYAVEAGYLF